MVSGVELKGGGQLSKGITVTKHIRVSKELVEGGNDKLGKFQYL
jgi:hypothetical protein